MKKLLTQILLAVLLICTVSMLDGCAAKRTTPTNDPTFKPITGWEQTNYTNTQIAIHARAAAKATVAVRQTGFIDRDQFKTISSAEIRILKAHKQLTPYLKDLQTALANKDKIKPLVSLIGDTAHELVTSGIVGMKNPQSQAAVNAEITAVQSLANTLSDLLKTSGVL